LKALRDTLEKRGNLDTEMGFGMPGRRINLTRIDQAFGELQKPPETSQDEFLRLVFLASELRKSSRFEEGLSALEQATALMDAQPVNGTVWRSFELAEEYIEYGKNQSASNVLQRAKVSIEIERDSSQGDDFWRLAIDECQIASGDEALGLINKAEQVRKPDSSDITNLIDKVGKRSTSDDAIRILKRIDELIEKRQLSDQAEFWAALAGAEAKLGYVDDATKALVLAQQTANTKSLEDKADVMGKVAATYAQLGKWKQAVDTALSIGSEIGSISALARILIISRDTRDNASQMKTLAKYFDDIRSEFYFED